MYPSSSSASASSSSSTQPQQSSISHTGLTRYGSAPGSLLTSTVDAVIGGSRFLAGQGQGQGQGHGHGHGQGHGHVHGHGHGHGHGHYYSGDSSEPSCKEQRSSSSSYEAFPGSSLLRQKSSPAGFLSHLANTSTHNAGFTITRGNSRLKSELSFTGHGQGQGQGQGQECLSRISEGMVDPTSDHTTSTPTYAATGTAFGIQPSCSWDNSNSIVFSAPQSNKRSKTNDPDILHCLSALESQFSLPQTTLEMATVDKLYIPEDSVPCKIRAKRGCATHPRSIAERERRTRISGRLKKLQDLVPNMDKQTSYADMLDLAVQHIKGLQSQVQKLHKELESCTCGCKQST